MKQHHRYLLPLLALLSLSPPSPAADPAPASNGAERLLPDKEQERMMALSASQPVSTEVLWLETQHESFLGLFQPANQPQPRGGILLLPHDRTSPDWPGAMQTLRRGLPDKGWHTLAIALPDEPLPILPRFDSASAASDSGAAKGAAPLQDHFQRIAQRIEVGLNTLRQRGVQKIYLVGEGSGGYWASRYLDEHDEQALYPILIDATQPTTPAMPLLQRLTEKQRLPALDLYHGNGLARDPIEQQARLRADSAKRAGLPAYLSVRMAPRAGDWRQTDPRLLAVVSGLIERHLEKATQPKAAPPAAAPSNRRPGRKP